MKRRFNGVDVPDYFKEVIIPKSATLPMTVKVEFADYIVKPFDGFDFHDKWNNGIPPFGKVMYGDILKETDGMWYFELHPLSNFNTWRGWCPKKSCTVTWLKEDV